MFVIWEKNDVWPSALCFWPCLRHWVLLTRPRDISSFVCLRQILSHFCSHYQIVFVPEPNQTKSTALWQDWNWNFHSEKHNSLTRLCFCRNVLWHRVFKRLGWIWWAVACDCGHTFSTAMDSYAIVDCVNFVNNMWWERSLWLTLPLFITWCLIWGDLIVYTIEKAEASDVHLTVYIHQNCSPF